MDGANDDEDHALSWYRSALLDVAHEVQWSFPASQSAPVALGSQEDVYRDQRRAPRRPLRRDEREQRRRGYVFDCDDEAPEDFSSHPR